MTSALPRYTLALDLGKHVHVAHIYDIATGQRSRGHNIQTGTLYAKVSRLT